MAGLVKFIKKNNENRSKIIASLEIINKGDIMGVSNGSYDVDSNICNRMVTMGAYERINFEYGRMDRHYKNAASNRGKDTGNKWVISSNSNVCSG
jgi:hypothetical protein